MKHKYFSSLILMFLLCGMTAINAQVIVLSCKKKLTRDFLDNHTKFYGEMCSKYGGTMCDEAQKDRNNVRKCVQSGLNYSHKRDYTFEKKSLSERNETWVDMLNENCWGDNQNTRNVMTTTASTLFFADKESTFNVDRATLQGGWQEDRTWQCDVKEQAVKNKI